MAILFLLGCCWCCGCWFWSFYHLEMRDHDELWDFGFRIILSPFLAFWWLFCRGVTMLGRFALSFREPEDRSHIVEFRRDD